MLRNTRGIQVVTSVHSKSCKLRCFLFNGSWSGRPADAPNLRALNSRSWCVYNSASVGYVPFLFIGRHFFFNNFEFAFFFFFCGLVFKLYIGQCVPHKACTPYWALAATGASAFWAKHFRLTLNPAFLGPRNCNENDDNVGVINHLRAFTE